MSARFSYGGSAVRELLTSRSFSAVVATAKPNKPNAPVFIAKGNRRSLLTSPSL